jgi:hypothetical protein
MLKKYWHWLHWNLCRTRICIKKASDEYYGRLAENPFIAMIPDGVNPPLDL